MPSSKGSPQPGIEHRSSTFQTDSSLSEAQGKPMNTAVGNIALLQEIFPTQESNQGPTLHADSLPAELPGKPRGLGYKTFALTLDTVKCFINYLLKRSLFTKEV